MSLYDGLRERGVKVPEDLSVVGFDNQEVIAAHVPPLLTTVALPHHELGQSGVRLLLGLETPCADSRLIISCPPIERDTVTSAAR